MKLRKLLEVGIREPEILVTASTVAEINAISERIGHLFNDKVSFETPGGTVFVRKADIDSVEVRGNYCDIYLAGGVVQAVNSVDPANNHASPNSGDKAPAAQTSQPSSTNPDKRGNGRLTVRSSLTKLQALLGEDFIQISRYALINFSHLRSVETDLANGMVAIVGLSADNTRRIPISRRFLGNVYGKIGELA